MALGVLFLGDDKAKPISWNCVPEFVMDETHDLEEQSKIFATMQNSKTITLGCRINKNGVKNLMEIFRTFKLAKGPERKRMIRRAMKMRTNYSCSYTFRKEGDEYVNERGTFRFVLQ